MTTYSRDGLQWETREWLPLFVLELLIAAIATVLAAVGTLDGYPATLMMLLVVPFAVGFAYGIWRDTHGGTPR